MCRWVLLQSGMASCVFCYILVKSESRGKLCISSMDFGLMCLIPCGHTRKPMEREKKMMMVFIPNCVRRVHVMTMATRTCVYLVCHCIVVF